MGSPVFLSSPVKKAQRKCQHFLCQYPCKCRSEAQMLSFQPAFSNASSKAEGDFSRAWMPVTDVRVHNEVLPGFNLAHALLLSVLGCEPTDGKFSLSISLSANQVYANKKINF